MYIFTNTKRKRNMSRETFLLPPPPFFSTSNGPHWLKVCELSFSFFKIMIQADLEYIFSGWGRGPKVTLDISSFYLSPAPHPQPVNSSAHAVGFPFQMHVESNPTVPHHHRYLLGPNVDTTMAA